MSEAWTARVACALLAVAFCLPTDLRISWDGLPLNHRAEFVFLLFALFVVACALARRLVGGDTAPASYLSSRRAWAIGVLALSLIAVKAAFPVSGGISRCWWGPHVAASLKLASDACLGAAERFVKGIDFGPHGEPWLPGLHNTLAYNYSRCVPGDAICPNAMRWRAQNALPFRASFALSPSRWPRQDDLRLVYAGRAELALQRKGGDVERIAFPFASTPADHRVVFSKADLAGMTLTYWNYACLGTAPDSPECLASESTAALPLSQAMVRVRLPEDGWRTGFRRAARVLTLGLVGLLAWTMAGAFWSRARECARLIDWRAPRGRVVVTVLELALLGAIGALIFRNHWPAVIRVAAVGALSAFLLVLWGNFAGRRRPDAAGAGDRAGTATVLCSFPLLCLWLWAALESPAADGFALQGAGDDWLTFTSEGYFLAASPRWFSHPSYVLSKPLFPYFRALFYPLLGEGTVYLDILLRFALGCAPILLVPLAMKSFQMRPGLLRVTCLTLFGVSFFWAVRNLTNFLLVFPVSMSEIPAWLFTLAGGITLLYSIEQEGRPHRRLLVLAAVLSSLALLMRPQVVAAWIPLWALAVASRAGMARRRAAIAAVAAAAGAGLIILVHALPALLAQRQQVDAYLGLTTGLGGSPPLRVLIATFWRRMNFESPVGTLVIVGGLLGVAFVHRRRRSLWASIGFASCYLAALATHFVIRDNAYLPRHYVLMAHTAAYLTLYCGIRVVSRGTAEERRLRDAPPRGVPPATSPVSATS